MRRRLWNDEMMSPGGSAAVLLLIDGLVVGLCMCMGCAADVCCCAAAVQSLSSGGCLTLNCCCSGVDGGLHSCCCCRWDTIRAAQSSSKSVLLVQVCDLRTCNLGKMLSSVPTVILAAVSAVKQPATGVGLRCFWPSSPPGRADVSPAAVSAAACCLTDDMQRHDGHP